MVTRAGIVVTGTEVLTGRVHRPQRPVAGRAAAAARGRRRARRRRRRPARRPARARWRFLAGTGVDLLITSGGLGPTADDLTAEVVGRRSRAARSALDRDARAADRDDRRAADAPARGWRADPAATAAGDPQAGAGARGRHGAGAGRHRPGLVVPAGRRPRRPAGRGAARAARASCRACGRRRVADPAGRERAGGPRRAAAGDDAAVGDARSPSWPRLCASTTTELAGLEITTCLRERRAGDRHPLRPRRRRGLRPRWRPRSRDDFARTLFSSDGRTVDELVDRRAAGARRDHRDRRVVHRRAAGRPGSTDRAGSSAYVLGGLVDLRQRRPSATCSASPAAAARHASARSAPRSPRRWPRGRASRLGADVGRRNHRHRRTRRRHARQAGRPGAPVRLDGRPHGRAPGRAAGVARRGAVAGRRCRAAPAARPARRRLSALGLTRRARGG